MIDKFFKVIMVGLITTATALVGIGWKAYGQMNDMGKAIKDEVKKEMLEIRDRDMDYNQKRFNTLEVLISGRIVSPQKTFENGETK